jgi:nitrate reductase NapA
VNWEFVNKHTQFRKGVTDIGYGLRPTNPLQQKAKNPDSGDSTPMSFDDFAKFVADYDLESVSKLSGVPKDKLEKLAQLYADPTRRWSPTGPWASTSTPAASGPTTSLQHPPADRQDLQPGSGPFSLTGQPSACGTAREVGTFAHRLPADMVVTNPSTAPSPRRSGSCRKAPSRTGGYHAVLQSRMLKDGKLNAYWTSATTTCRPARTSTKRGCPVGATRPTSSWCPTLIRPCRPRRPT